MSEQLPSFQLIALKAIDNGRQLRGGTLAVNSLLAKHLIEPSETGGAFELTARGYEVLAGAYEDLHRTGGEPAASYPHTLEDMKTLLADMPPVPRAKLLALLIDRRNLGVLAALRLAAVAEVVEQAGSVTAAAAELDVVPNTVSKALAEHRTQQP